MSHTVKTILLAGLLSVAFSGCYTPTRTRTVVVARTYERCDIDGTHCVRITCDRDGDKCWRRSRYYNNAYYRHEGRWVCDADGDRCHYEYTGRKWDPHWD